MAQEHLLVQGGEIFLPFARSRIKTLRALGIPFTSQTFKIEDTTIEVRITPGHDYISIAGGFVVMQMDSGVVDIGGYLADAPISYLDGTLYETTGAFIYNSPFVPTPPPDGPRKSTNPGNRGKLTGDITYRAAGNKSFSGKPPKDGQVARSFSAGSQQAGDSEFVRNEQDEGLIEKKQIAVLVPASIYTGKTRLYVQAMYGKPLYQSDKKTSDGATTEAGNKNYVPTLWPYSGQGNIAPALTIQPVLPKDAGGDYEANVRPVLLSTSSGVYLDPVTGKHWQFNVSGAVEAYPLVSSKVGESLRPYLAYASGSTKGKELDVVDREHLEAYILSDCRPDSAKKLVASGAIGPMATTWSLGYSWHWNWSGTVADIVIFYPVDQPPIGGVFMEANESIHYRIEMTPERNDEKDIVQWICRFTVVEGAKRFTALRGRWSIVEPNWLNMLLNKATPKHGTAEVCDAPFYAFYRRDDLQVCRFSLTDQAASPGQRKITPGFGAPEYAGPVNYATFGFADGFYQDWVPGSKHFSATVSCGNEIAQEIDAVWVRAGARGSVGPKTQTGWDHFGGPAVSAGDFDVLNEAGGYTHFTNVTISAPSDIANLEFTRTVDVTSQETSGSAIIVVPPNDSEAVYFRVDKTVREWSTSGVKDLIQTNASLYLPYVIRTNIFSPAGVYTSSQIGYQGAALVGAYGATITPVDRGTLDDVTVTTVSKELLICNAGNIPVTWGSIDQFFGQPEDEVIATFITCTSVGSAVVAPSRVVPAHNVNDRTIGTPVFVGWA